MKIKHIVLLLLIAFTLFGCKEESAKTGGDDISSLSPLKDDFAGKFQMIGNIFNPSDVSSSKVTTEALTRHYNVLTAENNMKPNQLSSTKGSYNWNTADNMVDAAIASGFKVVGHTLLWHSQIPTWQQNITSSTALVDMKDYITGVVTHFKGKIYSWDVLNEAFPDGVSATADWKKSMREGNPWFKALGSDFVYEGFLAARIADPDAILYYNDYNTDQVGKATMIYNMVRDVNQKYKTEYPNETRLLIEGIGMQEHHNTGVSASAIKATLNLFKPLGVRISVSELDVLIVSYGEFDPYGHGPGKQGSITGDKRTNGLKKQAELYEQYFKVYLEFSDIIERVSFWGVTDDKSWRSAALPLLFDEKGKAKDAYYSVIGTVK
ncbi:MAG: endo-1,4-beta-xylanase [Treponema sp.]|jgi:endo-1,4-beta-xylanase|nr:endo-1,4-beta-xylanase [Treponema sp.]